MVGVGSFYPLTQWVPCAFYPLAQWADLHGFCRFLDALNLANLSAAGRAGVAHFVRNQTKWLRRLFDGHGSDVCRRII